MKKLLAALTIATLPVVGFASMAHADDRGTPADPLPGNLCIRPGQASAMMPVEVPCDSPEATTPYVPDAPKSGSYDPTHVAHLADGTCVTDRVAVPQIVTCPSEAVTPAVTAARAPTRKVRTTPSTASPSPAPVVVFSDPISFAFEYWVGV
jgi:hypothetical protein